MESFADTLEGMRRHAQETEPFVFTVTADGFVNLLHERIAEVRHDVEGLPGAQELLAFGNSADTDLRQAVTNGQQTAT